MKTKPPNSEASVLNFAVFQTSSKFGLQGLDQNGRTMYAILDLILRLHLSPPRNSVSGCPASARTNCRMRRSFVSILRFIGRLLEDGHFDEANREALAWKPFLNKAK